MCLTEISLFQRDNHGEKINLGVCAIRILGTLDVYATTSFFLLLSSTSQFTSIRPSRFAETTECGCLNCAEKFGADYFLCRRRQSQT